MLAIDLISQELYGVFIGYILDHKGGSLIIIDIASIDNKIILVK